jgi:hypothetical protein
VRRSLVVAGEEGGRLLTVAGCAVVAADGSVKHARTEAVVGADVVRVDVGVTVAADNQAGQTVGGVDLGRGVVVGMGESVAGVAAKHIYILPKQRWQSGRRRGAG